jgi:hypothetical protein|tara:strand:+ start:1501 stop:1950 length:450 start_codon:yes stop_codon:yes gene_type:complete
MALRLTGVDPRQILSASAADANLPQTGASTLFTIADGNIEVIAIVGTVGTVIQAQANATKLEFDSGNGPNDLCATLDINAHTSGSLYYVTGTVANAMVNVTDGIILKQATPWILGPGDIELDCAASNTGTTSWVLYYRKLDAAATVTGT